MAATVVANFTGPCKVSLAVVTGHHNHQCCKGLLRGHSIIIVQQQGTDVYDYYHIGDVEIPNVWNLQNWMGNTQGTIGAIIAERVPGGLGYNIEASTNWNDVPALDVNRMVKEILAQRVAVAQNPIPYQKAGNERWPILGGNGGHSCVTWAVGMVAVANLKTNSAFISSTKGVAPAYAKAVNATLVIAGAAVTAVAAIASKTIKKT